MRARRRRRRLDLGCGGPRELDRALLLGEPVGKLRRRRDSCLERGTTLRRERPVRERREFDDLLTGVVVLSTASHGHGTTHGNAERATAWRDAPRKRLSNGAMLPRKNELASNAHAEAAVEERRIHRNGPKTCHTIG